MYRTISTLLAYLAILIGVMAPAMAVPPMSVPQAATPTGPYFLGQVNIACLGDSIEFRQCDLGVDSVLGYSLMKYPRAINSVTNLAVNSSGSGTNVGKGVGTCTANCPWMDDTTSIATLCAIKNLVVFMGTGGNDSGGGGFAQTRANFKDAVTRLIACNPVVKIILQDSAPQATRTGVQYIEVANYMRALARAYTPNVFYFQMTSYDIDETTNHQPKSGYTEDDAASAHPTHAFAKAAEPAMTALLDQLGVARIFPEVGALNDRYNASTMHGGNLAGILGYMGGSSTLSGGNITGFTAIDTPSNFKMNINTSTGSELTGSAALTTLTYNGNTYRAIATTFSPASALTADRTFTFSVNNQPTLCTSPCGGSNSVEAGRYRFSAIVQVSGSTPGGGLKNINLFFKCTSNSVVGKTWNFGVPDANTNATTPNVADMVDGIYPLVMPYDIECDAGGNSSSLTYGVNAVLRSGTQPTVTITVASMKAVLDPTP